MQKISFFILFFIFVSYVANAAENTVSPKSDSARQVVRDKTAGGRLTKVEKDGPKVRAVKVENLNGALCQPNTTLSCTTKIVADGEEVCKQDTCVCANSSGSGTYPSTGTKYKCIPKPTEKKPAEIETPDGGGAGGDGR